MKDQARLKDTVKELTMAWFNLDENEISIETFNFRKSGIYVYFSSEEHDLIKQEVLIPNSFILLQNLTK